MSYISETSYSRHQYPSETLCTRYISRKHIFFSLQFLKNPLFEWYIILRVEIFAGRYFRVFDPNSQKFTTGKISNQKSEIFFTQNHRGFQKCKSFFTVIFDPFLDINPLGEFELLCGGKIQRYEEYGDDETDSEWEAEEGS